MIPFETISDVFCSADTINLAYDRLWKNKVAWITV